MFSTLPIILVAYSIISADIIFGQLTDEEIIECCEQKTYDIAPEITPPLTIKLYYHAGKGIEPDSGFVKAACLAMESFPDVTVIFVVGDGVVQGPTGLECINKGDKNNKDCSCNYEHACASKLANYLEWVCCTVNGKSGSDCMAEQDETKVEELNQCTLLQDPNINPVEILLNNISAEAQEEDDLGCAALLLFNDMSKDACARFMFYEDPVKVIKALLHIDD